MRIASFLGLAATACVLWVSQAHAQRVQFPTPDPVQPRRQVDGVELSGGPVFGTGGHGALASAYQYRLDIRRQAPSGHNGAPGATIAPNPAYQAPNYTARLARRLQLRPGWRAMRPPARPHSRHHRRATGQLGPYATPGTGAAALPADPYLPGALLAVAAGGGTCERCSSSWTSFVSTTRGCPAMVPRLGMHSRRRHLRDPVSPQPAPRSWSRPALPPPGGTAPLRRIRQTGLPCGFTQLSRPAWNPQITPCWVENSPLGSACFGFPRSDD